MPKQPIPSIAFALVAGSLLSPSLACASMRASYEVSLSANGETHSIRTAETLASNQAITQVLGEHTVQLLPVVGADGTYNLQITVTAAPERKSGIVPEETRSFSGALSGPMEFTAQFGDAQVSGALMLRYSEE